MKKSLVLLAGASMAFLGLPAVSHAQAASGPFADVPTDHWAYQSVDTLQKAGIVIGYPDGTYGGRRPMTRYEFAVAIARLLAQMNAKPAGVSQSDLDALRTDLQNRIAGNTAAIDALRTLVNGFQPELTRLGQDVAAANARLDALEARVNALNGRLTNDEGILGSVVDEQKRFHVTGDVNFIAEADASRRRYNGGGSTAYVPFLDKNGVYQGSTFGGQPLFQDRLLQTSDVYHDVLLHIRGKVADTTTANVDLDFGNYLSAVGNTAAFGGVGGGAANNLLGILGLGGNFGNGGVTPGTLTAGAQYANVYKAYLDSAVKLGPLGGAELLLGRFGNQYTKYTLMQADADIYTNLTQTDSGDLITDGASVSGKAGPAHLNLWAGKFTATPFSRPFGGSTNTLTGTGTTNSLGVFTQGPTVANAQTRPGGLIASNHAAPLDQGAGARVTFGTPESAVVGLTVEQFGLSNGQNLGFGNVNANNLGQATIATPNGLNVNDGITDPNRPAGSNNAQYNRLSVYGLDFNGALPFGVPGTKKGGVLIDAAYTVSAEGLNTGFNNVGNGFRYSSYDANAGFAVGGIQLKGGYQYVGPDFSAPGYWGKIGAWSNPTNVRGPVLSAKYSFTPKLSLNADGELYTAAYGNLGGGNAGPVNSPLQSGDHLNRYQVGLGYGLSSSYAVDLGYESVWYGLENRNGTLLNKGNPTESYTTIGLGHSLSSNASVKLLYQIVHYEDHNTGFDPISAPTGGKSDGSVAAAQFQLKF